MPTDHYLERLMQEYGDSIFRMCYLYLKDYHLAEDAVQETFIKAMKSYDTFAHKSSEKTWLIRIAINTCKNIMRNRWFQIIQNNLEDHIEKIGDNPIEEMLEKNSVSEAIMRLNANDRQIILLYYYQNLSVSRGLGTAIPFALELISLLFGEEKAEEIRKSVIYRENQ